VRTRAARSAAEVAAAARRGWIEIVVTDPYNRFVNDAVHVIEIGLRAVEDAQVAAVARSEGRAVVTENVADFAAERDLVLVFVLKRNLPAGGAQATALAEALDDWAHANPDAYLGPHWPPLG
jgi:hypothetical protein